MHVNLCRFPIYCVLSRGEGFCLFQGGREIHCRFCCGEKTLVTAAACATARAQGVMSLRTRKRSFKRATRRALRDGFAYYRGRRFTKEQLLGNQNSQPLPGNSADMHSGNTPSGRKKIGQANRSPRFQFFNWNAGGLSSETYDMLLSLLNHLKITVAHIQETHWSFSSTWSTDQYHCIHSGAPKPGTAGCLTMVHKDFCRSSQIKFQCVVPGRLLHVRIPLRQTFLNLLNVYQQYVSKPDADDSNVFQRAHILHQLDNVTQCLPRRHLLLTSGDFNAKLRPQGAHVGRAVGRSSMREDEDLLAYIAKHDLVAVNTWGSASHFSNSFAGNCSVIDFVFLRRQHADPQARQVKYLYDHPLHPPRPSFHVPLVTSINSFWQCWQHDAGSPCPQRPATDSFLADVATQAPRYMLYLDRLRDELAKGDCRNLDVDSVIHRIATEIYPPKLRSARSLDNAMQHQVATGWSLWIKLRKLHGRSLLMLLRGWHLAARLQLHRRRHRKIHRQVKRARLKDLMHQAALAAQKGDQRELHKLVRMLSPKQTKIKLQLRNSNGYLMTNAEESAAIQAHMNMLYVQEGAENLLHRHCYQIPFDEMSLYQSLLDIPPRKSVPPGFPESAFVKHAASVITPFLFAKLKTSWNNGTALVPSKWRMSWLCWIPKPFKNHSKMTGWRGISLQSPIGKAVLRCVERAARAQSAHRMHSDPQFAYTKGRGTGDAITRALIHQAEALRLADATKHTLQDYKAGREKATLGGGLQVCLDINQAFDKVPRHHLIRSAGDLEVGHDELSLLNNWHVDTEYVSPTSSKDVSVCANSGVRQGCVAAPTLWNMYIHSFLIRIADVFTLQWVKDHLTIYADDFHIFFVFDSEAGFQKALTDLRKFLDELMDFGLDLNMDKTVVLLNLKGKRSAKWRHKVIQKEGSEHRLKLAALTRPNPPLLLRLVSTHKYLGIMLSYKNCQDATWKLRRDAASGTFARLRKWWGSTFPLQERIKLWFQTVWPTLTYGLSDVGLSQRGVRYFHGFVMRHLRILARSPRGPECETNDSLLSRLKLQDPFEKLSLITLTTWKRRTKLAAQVPTQNILSEVSAMCEKAVLCKHLLWQWWRRCFPSWQKYAQEHSEDSDLPSLLRQLGLQDIAAEPSQDSPCLTLARQYAAKHDCSACSASFPHQMALRLHMRACHGFIAKAVEEFKMENDALEGLPTCRHCGFQFRYWRGLKQHINNDTCPARDERAVRLRNLHLADFDPSTSPIIANQDLLSQIRHSGAEAYLDQPSPDQLWPRLARQCCLCTQWCPTSTALGHHLSAKHCSVYKKGCDWANNRIKAKVLPIQNPCRWCGASFAQSTVLSRHRCPVVVQAGIIESIAQGHTDADDHDDDDDDDDPVEAASSSRPVRKNDGERCSWSDPGCLPRATTVHVRRRLRGKQHDRCEQENDGRRRASERLTQACATTEQEAAKQQSKEGWSCSESPQRFHGAVSREHGASHSETRGCDQSHSLRRWLPLTLENYRAHSASFVKNLAQVARRQGLAQPQHRRSSTHSSGGMLLQGVARLHCKDGEAHDRDGGVQEAGRGEHPVTGALLLQDQVGCGERKSDQHWSQPRSGRCDETIGAAGAVADHSLFGTSISLNQAHVRAVFRKISDFCAGAEFEGASFDRCVRVPCGDVGDNDLRCDAVQNEACHASALTLGSGAAEAAGVSRLSSTWSTLRATSTVSAFRTWMLHGRNQIPLPRLANEGNRCYRNAAVSALVVCYHHTSEHSGLWGCIHDIVMAAQHEWQGLYSVASFCCSQENWREPQLQHDAYEYLLHLAEGMPILQRPISEARFMTQEGVIREECMCALDLSCSSVTMQEGFNQWRCSSGVVKALLAAPPVLLIPAVRFVYDNRLLRRQTATVQLEPSELELPVYACDQDIVINPVRYRCVACILHQGATPSSGHYRTLAYCNGGYVITDDEKFGEFWENPLSDDLSQIYVLCLIRVSIPEVPREVM